jgi:transposase
MPKEQSPGKPTTRRYSPEEKAAAVRGLARGLGRRPPLAPQLQLQLGE